jgi:hypothetical protein
MSDRRVRAGLALGAQFKCPEQLAQSLLLTGSCGRARAGLEVFDNADRGSGRHGRWAGLTTREECLALIRRVERRV